MPDNSKVHEELSAILVKLDSLGDVQKDILLAISAERDARMQFEEKITGKIRAIDEWRLGGESPARGAEMRIAVGEEWMRKFSRGHSKWAKVFKHAAVATIGAGAGAALLKFFHISPSDNSHLQP